MGPRESIMAAREGGGAMIQVSIEFLFLAYLGTALSVIGICWCRARIVRYRMEGKELAHRVQCTLCAHVFEDNSATLLPRCPQCGNLNERVRLRNL